MVGQVVIINLGQGNWQRGFPNVIAQIGTVGRATAIQISGSLPPAPELADLYARWQRLYRALSIRLRSRSAVRNPKSKIQNPKSKEIEFEEDDDYLSNVSQQEFDELCQQLERQINHWLNAESFHRIDRQLRTQLTPSEEVRVIIEVENEQLRRLPWHLWHFFEDYPKAEVALSPQEYEQVEPVAPKGRILAILGHASGIDIQKDRAILERLPGAETVFLVEPQREELDRYLWDDRGWDILFFAGHSSSWEDGEIGQIEINPTESLTIAQLKNALRAAIARGLKLAIFNSCDGLGLARQLDDLNLPQLIVMREPVPDRVAQAFLKHLLAAFSSERSFYAAVREAREKLQGLETDFPCASWLPVICQNPTTILPPWPELFPVARPSGSVSRPVTPVLWASFAVAAVVIVARLFGFFQPLELKAFDALLRLRPQEGPDPRLLVIAVTAKDIQKQRSTEPEFARSGRSLSDRSLETAIEKLESYRPRVMGLDIYRDFPASPKHRDLIEHLREDDRLIAVCKAGEDNSSDLQPPPEIAPKNVQERVGFSDVIADKPIDGIVRRQLFGMAPPVESRCRSSVSLALQVALRYLKDERIEVKLTEAGDLQIGKVILKTLGPNSGGYHHMAAEGYQILLNYRATKAVATQLTLGEAIDGNQLTPELVKDRIILIGTVDESFGDVHRTPYNRENSEKTPGVIIQAHMVSQILSAVLDKRPLLWWWPEWVEMLWILVWSGVGGSIGWMACSDRGTRSRSTMVLAGGVAIAVLASGCYLVLWIDGGWLPLVPPAISVIAAIGTVGIFQRLK